MIVPLFSFANNAITWWGKFVGSWNRRARTNRIFGTTPDFFDIHSHCRCSSAWIKKNKKTGTFFTGFLRRKITQCAWGVHIPQNIFMSPTTPYSPKFLLRSTRALLDITEASKNKQKRTFLWFFAVIRWFWGKLQQKSKKSAFFSSIFRGLYNFEEGARAP